MDCRCITGLENIGESVRGCVLTIGIFDGVHLGHQKILSRCREHADRAGCSVVALTLHPHPAAVLHPEHPPLYLMPLDTRSQLLGKAGADFVVTVRTDDSLLDMAPEEFVKCIIVKRFAPVCLVEGPNFFFGLARSGTVKTLERAGQFEGFDVDIVESVSVDLSDGQQGVSSTLIRSLIRGGRVEDAATCMGREYCLFGQVVPGQGRGRDLEYPTANVDAHDQITPADGVYAGTTSVEGNVFPAAISVGIKPTRGPAAQTVEAYLLDDADFDAGGMDIYGRGIALSFTHRLRDQAKFACLEDLKAQIAKDVCSVRRIYSERI